MIAVTTTVTAPAPCPQQSTDAEGEDGGDREQARGPDYHPHYGER
jgi:hypothetical protein